MAPQAPSADGEAGQHPFPYSSIYYLAPFDHLDHLRRLSLDESMIPSSISRGLKILAYFSHPKCLTIAHRGASGYLPENSLAAFSRALELGAEAIELDVWRIEDELVVFHDRRLERLTNGKGVLIERSFSEVRSFYLHNGETIPTLFEVLTLLDGRCALNIEIKGPDAEDLVIECVGKAIETKRWKREQFLVSSFLHTALEVLHKKEPSIALGYLFHGIPLRGAEEAVALNCFSLNLSLDCVNHTVVKEARARGLKVFVYTVNARDDMERMLRLGVDGFFTDYVDVARLLIDTTLE